MFYVVHHRHPGIPWGPFPSKDAARDYRAMLLRYFTGPYAIRENY